MKERKIWVVFVMVICFAVGAISSNNVFAEDTGTIQLEIKYTNGDMVDFYGMKVVVYQDYDKTPILEKTLEGNPDVITVSKNHRYKIEVYANGMYADVGYIQLNNNQDKLNINIPLSGGLKFEVYYKNGNPINDATVVLKSQDNVEWRKGSTNDQGETLRYWIQSTNRQQDHYIADVYLGEIFITSYYPIKIQPGIAIDQKINTKLPEIVQELITINLFSGSKKITSDNGNYQVTLTDTSGNIVGKSFVNYRGDAQFSNLKSGTYSIKITTGNKIEDALWPENSIQIIGNSNNFNVYKHTKEILDQEKPFHACNCIAFRLDDIQDYWLADTQIEIIKLFEEKNIPLTIGVIGNATGSDQNTISIIKEGLTKNILEIANHSWNNEVLLNLNKTIQEKYIIQTNQKIFEIFGIVPTSFIPPLNLYNNDTVEILKRNGFTHLVAHTLENNELYVDKSFYNVPATTETGILVKGVDWVLNERNQIKADIVQSINQNGYAIIMMHPQGFTLKNNGVFGEPNQKSLSELKLLLDDVSELDAHIVKIKDVKNVQPEIKNYNDTSNVPVTNANTNSTVENIPDTCNCVSFRLDGVQDYWLNDVQIKIMDTFVENKTPLTVGIIADAFGNDKKIRDFIIQNVGKLGVFEVATKGMGLTPYTNYDKTEQNQNLQKSIEKIKSTINVTPHVFIPPNNMFNSDTIEILEENKITHFSSSLINEAPSPFKLRDEKIYRFPQITSTGKFNPATNIYEGKSSQQILEESRQGITNYGFAVISIQPQEFSTIINSTYTNSINQKQISELTKLIKGLKDEGYKIVPIGKINSNLVVLVPEWIKNNAGWWADGQIDDKTFVQGIEYLVKNGIITY